MCVQFFSVVPEKRDQLTIFSPVAAPFYRKISHWLSEGTFKCNRPKILAGGLADVFKGLDLLKNGQVHGEKLVYRIADMPGFPKEDDVRDNQQS